MNTSRLREIVDLLLEREKTFKIQQLLSELHSHLSTLASNPQDGGTQTNFANSLDKLRTAMSGMMASFQPGQVKLLEEIGANPFFTTDLPAQISAWVQENPITPAVTQQKLTKLVSDRAAYIDDITQLKDRLKKLNIEATTLPVGAAEIGFLIPRDLFHNQFDELIKELGSLNYIMRTISEAATGNVQPIEVREISTTDPQFFFGLDPATIAMLGGIVTWALAQWKQAEEIRKLRSETRKNSAFSDHEIKDFFDTKIERNIKEAIEAKTAELLGSPVKETKVSQQKHIELSWALESILARIERGMTVEIRFVPPAATQEPADENQSTITQFAAIENTVRGLIFPAPDATPILQLPPPEPDKAPLRAKDAK